MKCDYAITGGRVIDPLTGVDRVQTVWVKDGYVAADSGDMAAETRIDASGCLVLPGLIDFHTHLGYQMSDFGLEPDLYTLPNGVTAAVDAGSGGTANFEGMYTNVFSRSMIDIRCFLNVAATGIITERYPENLDPDRFDIRKIEYLMDRYGAHILGFKVRAGKNTSGPLGLRPLEGAVELGRRFGKRVCLHATNLTDGYDQILPVMRQGDIVCHIFQGGSGHTILDSEGHVADYVLEGRRRGIIFDCACGRINYSNRVMRQAFEDGFWPDIISTDIIGFSIYGPKIHSLLSVMSHYLAFGMELTELVRAVTQTPAAVMGMEGQIGTLKPDAQADVCIVRLEEHRQTVTDRFGDTVMLDRVFVPQLTLKRGKLAYRSITYTPF